MTTQRPVAYAALGISLLALLSPMTGVANAAAHIGKNLVVSKSIKNGAVTGAKLAPGAVDGSAVKDGSLTVADLAAGTIPAIPAPGTGKGIELGGCSGCVSSNPGVTFDLTPVGVTPAAGALALLLPVGVLLDDFRATGPQELISGQAMTISLMYQPPGDPGPTAKLLCTLTSSNQTCAAGGITLTAGTSYFFRTTNGAFGGEPGDVQFGYTLHAQ